MLFINIKYCIGCCVCVKILLFGKGSMCVLKDDFEWLFDKMKDVDGIVVLDFIFEEGVLGLFYIIMDCFGFRVDRGNNIIGIKVVEVIGGKILDLRMFNDKVILFMGIGGFDWGIRV